MTEPQAWDLESEGVQWKMWLDSGPTTRCSGLSDGGQVAVELLKEAVIRCMALPGHCEEDGSEPDEEDPRSEMLRQSMRPVPTPQRGGPLG